tara:strand:- start:720 stop:953 length:234 start_codon:yes stop_codon:yes gene_type:complete
MKKIIILFILTIYPSFAFAYIDPGTISIVLQGLIGAIAAIIVALKIYWYKILNLLGIQKKINIDQNNKNNDTINNKK